MKKDILILLRYLDLFQTSFNHSEMFLKGAKEDAKRLEICKKIQEKYKITDEETYN